MIETLLLNLWPFQLLNTIARVNQIEKGHLKIVLYTNSVFIGVLIFS